jgi:CheY-like chemotaxis protein
MKRVLVADDTKSIRALVAKCMEMEGYGAVEAVDGREALVLADAATASATLGEPVRVRSVAHA